MKGVGFLFKVLSWFKSQHSVNTKFLEPCIWDTLSELEFDDPVFGTPYPNLKFMTLYFWTPYPIWSLTTLYF